MKIFPITPKRYFSFAKNKTSQLWLEFLSLPQQYTPFSDQHTDESNCVIGNGIPKSGTHLINQILNVLGKWKNIRHFINETHYELKSEEETELTTHRCSMSYAVTKLRNGQFISGHLPWSRELERNISKVSPFRNIKHVLIYRDPRDTHVSYMKFVTHSHRHMLYNKAAKEEQRFMHTNFSNDDERLTYVIKLRKNPHLRYRRWLDSPHCFPVKFECLYQDIQGLKNNVWGETLSRLLEYLGSDPTTIDPIEFYRGVYGRSATAMPIEQKIGQYKTVFKKQHYALLDTPDFRKTFEDFGYEW